MTNFTSPSAERPIAYESTAWVTSRIAPGVRFLIERMSLRRKIDLAQRIREIGRRMEFLESGSSPIEQLEAAALSSEIDQAYVLWGLKAIDGLLIDGTEATVEALLHNGPHDLAAEAVRFVKDECGLTESERKN